MVKIFVSEIADSSKNPNLPEGEYECIVTKVAETVSAGDQSVGSPMWTLRLRVTSPDKVGDVVTQGFELMTWITFCNTGNLASMWRESVEILGFTVEKGKDFVGDPKLAEGRIIKAIVKTLPDKKKVMRSKVVKILKSEAQDDMGKVPF